MKKITVFLLCLFVLIFSPSLPIAAESPWVIDGYGLLSDGEEAGLSARIEGLRETYGVDIVIVTSDGTGGKTPEAYADDYYDYNGYAEDGALLLVDMGNRKWHISTKGYCITVFTDYGIRQIGADISPGLGSGDYYGSFSIFLDDAESYLAQASEGHPYDAAGTGEYSPGYSDGATSVNRSIINPVATLAALAVALVIVLIMKSRLKTARPKPYASDFVVKNSLRLTRQSDQFTHSTMSQIRRAQDHDTNSGGGGSGTHISSSGSTHGGGGGSF
ncbi:MAG: TPM domain-containing protein [Oscillospiraceae bacterium]|nr:TPM domain-containing protein [Oscillospiraceae bacterium]